MANTKAPIGIFDSGYGGLTVFAEIKKALPEYDFIYMGDNARAPYGSRSFETVYEYTLQSVKWFFEMNCPLVILACNTASAKALRTIQQNDLEHITAPDNRVLGVIRPTTEMIGNYTKTNHIGIVATSGTVNSLSYPIEIKKFWPSVKVHQQACPMWVPLIENNEINNPGAVYFIKKELDKLFEQNPLIDTLLLGCTHYPILQPIIQKLLPAGVSIVSQGSIVANSLCDYLSRHAALNNKISKNGITDFYTTDDANDFNNHAKIFYENSVDAIHLEMS
jgi:glutamate racemase